MIIKIQREFNSKEAKRINNELAYKKGLELVQANSSFDPNINECSKNTLDKIARESKGVSRLTDLDNYILNLGRWANDSKKPDNYSNDGLPSRSANYDPSNTSKQRAKAISKALEKSQRIVMDRKSEDYKDLVNKLINLKDKYTKDMIVKREKEFNERELIKDLAEETIGANVPILGATQEVIDNLDSRETGEGRLSDRLIDNANKLSRITKERVGSILENYKDQLTPARLKRIAESQNSRENLSDAARTTAKILRSRAIPTSVLASLVEGPHVLYSPKRRAEQKEFGRWGDLLYRGASRLMDSLDDPITTHSLFEEVDGLYRDSEDGDKPDSTYKVKEFFDDLRIEPKNGGFIHRVEVEDWRKKLSPKDYPELFKAMEGGRNKEITVKL